MRVALYRVEFPFGPFPLLNHGESAFNLKLKLRCLAREEVYGDCIIAAAAQVYFDAVGVYRKEKLCEMGAPACVIAPEANPKAIESRLADVSFLREIAYMLDNIVETWFITVDWDLDEAIHSDKGQHEEDAPNAN